MKIMSHFNINVLDAKNQCLNTFTPQKIAGLVALIIFVIIGNDINQINILI